MNKRLYRVVGYVFLAVALSGHAQAPARPVDTVPAIERTPSGDAPEDPGPLATDLSPKLTRIAVQAAMRKVADWQIATAESRFNRQWTYNTLYDGLIATSVATGDPKYRAAVERVAEKFDWKLAPGRALEAANLEHMGVSYIALNELHPAPEHLADTRRAMDELVARPDPPYQLLWWWCDALYMAPPVLAHMYRITGDRKYLDSMDREWAMTSAVLYDQHEHLFTRDVTFLLKKEANGRKLFWARGNGWVLGGLVQILQTLPKNDPSRPRYLQQYKDIIAAVTRVQGADGLWRTGLLDQASYKHPEISGSAFYAYAMAWGVNEGILSRALYRPRIARAWAGMIGSIYESGRLGSIQAVAAAPGEVPASSSYVYGVGAFLLAGSEIDRMAIAESQRKK